MGQSCWRGRKLYLLDVESKSLFGLTNCFQMAEIQTMREINAAVVNISGRQRMLSQRTALLALQLERSQTAEDRTKWRSALRETITLMEQSHQGLIYGDAALQLPGHPSPTVKSMYFEPPINLDRKIKAYIAAVNQVLATADGELTPENPHLRYILDAASGPLLDDLDAIVSEYQLESNRQQEAIALQQAELYRQSQIAATRARSQAHELAQALGELKNAQDRLIQSEKMSSLGQLLASVAHELNNPVSFIYGNVNHAIAYVQELLEIIELYQQESPHPSPRLGEYLEEVDFNFIKDDLPKTLSSIKIGSDSMHQLVLSLRNFSRKDEAVMRQVDIHEGIESALLILQNRLKANGKSHAITIIKDYGKTTTIEGFPCQINQVFMNLIGNAIDALEMKRGDWAEENEAWKSGEKQVRSSGLERPDEFLPTIHIRTHLSDREQVVIQISDNGPGMSSEVLSSLFHPFFTTKPVGKGTGLGLSISHQIVVEKHGGQIQCISTPGQGTEFWIELPVKQACRGEKLLPA
jgi:signal transduction histidine kinase